MKSTERIQAEIEQQRAELAETVDALVAKADLPAQARRRAGGAREATVTTAERVRRTAKERPLASGAVALGTIALVSLAVWASRRRHRGGLR